MSALFTKLDGDSVILSQGGLFRPCDLYERGDGELYAKLGAGFVRLYARGATSKAGVNVSTLVTELPLFTDTFARLCRTGGDKRQVLGLPETRALIGSKT